MDPVWRDACFRGGGNRDLFCSKIPNRDLVLTVVLCLPPLYVISAERAGKDAGREALGPRHVLAVGSELVEILLDGIPVLAHVIIEVAVDAFGRPLRVVLAELLVEDVLPVLPHLLDL